MVVDEMSVDAPEARLLLALLADELFGARGDASAGRTDAPAGSVDWGRFAALAGKHAVFPLVYGALKRLDGVPAGVLADARAASAFAAVQLEKYLAVQQQVVDCYAANGVPCAALKGLSVAALYPHPELRAAGDIDILVPCERLGEAVRLLEEAGCTRDEDFDMHVTLYCQGVCLEIHPKVSHYPDNERGRFAKATMEGALDHVTQRTLNGHTFPVLEDPWQAVALLSHMERHFVSGGIGLRQLCDWAVALHAMRRTDEVVDLVRRCGLLTYGGVVTSVCRAYLGLPDANPFAGGDAQDGCTAELARAALDDMLRTGNCHEQTPEQQFGAIFSGAYDDGGASWARNYLSFVRRRIANAYAWAKSPLWVPVFAVYLPLLQLAQVARGRSSLANPFGMMREADSRNELLKRMDLYR